MTGDDAKKELGTAKTITARQDGMEVTVTAGGEHPTSGFKDSLERNPIDVFPPELTLYTIPPGGITLPVFTPFTVSFTFNAKDAVKSVTVHDANGPHDVPVEN